MGKPDVAEIRRVLQVYDQSIQAGGRQAVGMLIGITQQVAKDPEAFDLLNDPADAEAWTTAGGESYCENQEFTNLLARRWLEILSKPDFGNAGYDREELNELKTELRGWIAAIEDTGLEFGDIDELTSQLDELICAAPEADDDSDEDE
jgi:hypothetical protein